MWSQRKKPSQPDPSASRARSARTRASPYSPKLGTLSANRMRPSSRATECRLLSPKVDELQVNALGAVPEARAKPQDTGVARGGAVEVGGHLLEEAADDGLVLEDLDRLAPGVEVVLLGGVYELVHDAAQLLGLGRGGLYAAVGYDLAGHRAEHRLAVLELAAELPAPPSVPHLDPRYPARSRTRAASSGSRPRSSSQGCGCS